MPSSQEAGIGSDNGLALKRREASTWIGVFIAYWRIYVSLDLDVLQCVVMHFYTYY